MGKYNLGKSTTSVSPLLSKTNLYVNESRANSIVKDINNQLDDMRNSLLNINIILNKSVKGKYVKGSRANSFKGWAKKCKSQADNSLKIKDKLNTKYEEDVRKYPIKLLDERIAELEKKIADLSK